MIDDNIFDDDRCFPENPDDDDAENKPLDMFQPEDPIGQSDADMPLSRSIEPEPVSSQLLAFSGRRDDKMLQDGFLSPIEIHDLIEDMRQEFGLRDLDVSEIPFFQNAARDPGDNPMYSFDDHILYDSDFLREQAAIHGSDVVTGIIAHEVGHTLIKPNISDHDHEFAADLIAGMVSARNGCGTDAMTSFYLSPEVRGESDTHPHGFFRLEKFREGYELAKNNPETALSELLSNTSVTDSINYKNLTFDNFYHTIGHRGDASGPGADAVSPAGHETGPKEIFSGRGDDVAFTGGLGICNIKCMRQSEDYDVYIPSSDLASD